MIFPDNYFRFTLVLKVSYFQFCEFFQLDYGGFLCIGNKNGNTVIGNKNRGDYYQVLTQYLDMRYYVSVSSNRTLTENTKIWKARDMIKFTGWDEFALFVPWAVYLGGTLSGETYVYLEWKRAREIIRLPEAGDNPCVTSEWETACRGAMERWQRCGTTEMFWGVQRELRREW